LYSSGSDIDVKSNSDDEGGGSMEDQDVKTNKVEEAVLLLLSYSNNNEISVCDSRPSSCPVYMFY